MFLNRRRPQSLETPMDLPMTPMIDVIFQLLIFFLCSMHFKEVEGKLETILPGEYGIDPNPTPNIHLNEIRIRLAYDGTERRTELRAGLMTARTLIGVLTDSTRDTIKSARAANAGLYARLRDQVKTLYTQAATAYPDAPPRVIIDADRDVSYEHVIGVLNACKEANIVNLEFTADPEHVRALQRH